MSWAWRYPPGVVLLLPAVGVMVWQGLFDRLVDSQRPWLVLIGIPVGLLLVAVSTFVTARKGASFAARQVLATWVAPLRTPPPARKMLWTLTSATGEELIFRLLGLWLLGQGVLGLTVTTAVFAVLHVVIARPGRRVVTVVDVGICGAALAGLYVGTGGIVAAVLAHGVRNLCLDSLRHALAEKKKKETDS